MDGLDALMTSEDVANYLKVDVVTVRRLVARGELGSYRVGGEFRFTASDLRDYLARQYTPARGGNVIARPGVSIPETMMIIARPGDPAMPVWPPRRRMLVQGATPGEVMGAQHPFERFGRHAKRVLGRAAELAARRGYRLVHPEHLLLALAQVGPDGVAGLLQASGLPLPVLAEAASHSLLEQYGPQSEPSPPSAPQALDLSAGTRQALEAAIEVADRLGHTQIQTEHLLLGLLADEQGSVVRLLAAQGAPADLLRTRIRALEPFAQL